MNIDRRKAYIRLRAAQAAETLADAKLLFEQNRLRSSVNRIYYAAFYAVSGLVVTTGKEFSKHTSVIGFFDREFVKTGIFAREFSRALHAAFDQRQEHDYLPFADLTHDEVESLLTDIERFVDIVLRYLRENHWLSEEDRVVDEPES